MLIINLSFRELFIALLHFNILLAFKFLSGYSTFGMFISGAEPHKEEMGTDLCFHCLHSGELEKTAKFTFTTVRMPFLYAIYSGISVQFAGLQPV